jgi:hypothetical protein
LEDGDVVSETIDPLFPAEAVLPLGKVCPMVYRKSFWRAYQGLHPDTQIACMRAITQLAQEGRTTTQSSQDHKLYPNEREGVPAPAGCRIARVSKKVRYLWGFEGENGHKRLVVYFVGGHSQVWDSEG